jgi:hypothetical protein
MQSPTTDLWRNDFVDPFRRYHLPSVPLPAIEHELTEPCHVARARTQAA